MWKTEDQKKFKRRNYLSKPEEKSFCDPSAQFDFLSSSSMYSLYFDLVRIIIQNEDLGLKGLRLRANN